LGPRDRAPNSSAGRWRLNGNARDVGKNRRASATRERATISGYARSMARPATVEGTAGSPATPLKRAAGPLETTSKTPGLAAWAFLQGHVVPFPYGGRCPISRCRDARRRQQSGARRGAAEGTSRRTTRSPIGVVDRTRTTVVDGRRQFSFDVISLGRARSGIASLFLGCTAWLCSSFDASHRAVAKTSSFATRSACPVAPMAR